MLNGELHVVTDVGEAFADIVLEEYASRPNPDQFVLALGGGSTATACYEALIDKQIDWSKVTIIWGDERMVPPDHEDSNYLLAKNAFLDKVGPFAAVHRMDMNEGAEAYDAIVRGLMPIDLVHLGMGDDGHTLSLFPGSPALNAPPEQLVLETGDDLHPHRRMTLTFSAVAQSRVAVFTIVGPKKAAMFNKIVVGEDYPAGQIIAGRVIWLADAEAVAQN